MQRAIDDAEHDLVILEGIVARPETNLIKRQVDRAFRQMVLLFSRFSLSSYAADQLHAFFPDHKAVPCLDTLVFLLQTRSRL